jgi:hypothetical protein
MSQKVNIEWRSVNLGSKHDVHRVSVHPITLDAWCSSLEEKVPLLCLPPVSFYWSVDGKQC